MNNMQALVDGMNAQLQRERSESQMTLGEMITALSKLPPETVVTPGLKDPHSYRGYYSDLAFEKSEEAVTAGELLQICKECMGEVFEGYKGGEFVMGSLTPLWVSEYGRVSGIRIMAITEDNVIQIAPEEY